MGTWRSRRTPGWRCKLKRAGSGMPLNPSMNSYISSLGSHDAIGSLFTLPLMYEFISMEIAPREWALWDELIGYTKIPWIESLECSFLSQWPISLQLETWKRPSLGSDRTPDDSSACFPEMAERLEVCLVRSFRVSTYSIWLVTSWERWGADSMYHQLARVNPLSLEVIWASLYLSSCVKMQRWAFYTQWSFWIVWILFT